jgi:hypothetical protein
MFTSCPLLSPSRLALFLCSLTHNNVIKCHSYISVTVKKNIIVQMLSHCSFLNYLMKTQKEEQI